MLGDSDRNRILPGDQIPRSLVRPEYPGWPDHFWSGAAGTGIRPSAVELPFEASLAKGEAVVLSLRDLAGPAGAPSVS